MKPPKIGRIFYDHSIRLWTLCLYDENDMILDECHYDHLKKDSMTRIQDYPTVERWEIATRNGDMKVMEGAGKHASHA